MKQKKRYLTGLQPTHKGGRATMILLPLTAFIVAGTAEQISINSKARAALPEQQRRINQRKIIEIEHERRLEEMRERWRKQDALKKS